MARRKYTIGEVLDNDTGKRSKGFGYRVGRTIFIDDEWLFEGIPLYGDYGDGRGWRTSTIKSIEQTDCGVWVNTMNRSYRLDRQVD